MKIRMTLMLCVLMLPFDSSFAQQSNNGPPTSHVRHAQARGCVHPGKEEGCFVLHDIKGRRFYDLTFKATGDKPDLYSHILFEGIEYPHDAHCSQGRPVHVTTWKILPGKCSRPTSKTTNK
jgi:hypothetical protein